MHASATRQPRPRLDFFDERTESTCSFMEVQEHAQRRSAGDMQPYHTTPLASVSSAWPRSPPRSSSLPLQLHALRLGDTAAHMHGHRDVVECASWSLTSPPRTTLGSLPKGWVRTALPCRAATVSQARMC